MTAQQILHKIRSAAEAEIARIAALAEGQVGVTATHLGNGLSVAVGDDAMYPPCSTVKMPLAAAVLDRIDRGTLDPGQLVEVRESDMNPVGIADDYPHPGVALSVANLLEATITRSCNTSTDVLFRLVGGPAGVMAYLQRAGLSEFRIEHTMRAALAVLHELALPPDAVSMRDFLRGQPQEVLDARERSNADFHHDQRDMCTPRAMQTLLVRLWRGELLQAATSKLLVDMMARTITGEHRIRARLAPGMRFAGKSGSGAGAAVEVGFLTLPEQGGTVALTAFVMGSPLTMAEREAVLADIGRLVADYFTVTNAIA